MTAPRNGWTPDEVRAALLIEEALEGVPDPFAKIAIHYPKPRKPWQVGDVFTMPDGERRTIRRALGDGDPPAGQ